MKTRKLIIDILLILWQLPQLVLGLLVLLFIRLTDKESVYDGKFENCIVLKTKKYKTIGVSFGCIIILADSYNDVDIRHEYGHSIQSKYLGILYLILIGLPSITMNIFDRLFHKKWHIDKRIKWYHNLIWEKTADKLGGVYSIYSQL